MVRLSGEKMDGVKAHALFALGNADGGYVRRLVVGPERRWRLIKRAAWFVRRMSADPYT